MLSQKKSPFAKPQETAATKPENYAAPLATASNSLLNTDKSTNPKATETESQEASKGATLIVQYDAGFPNTLYIRGEGANLSWNKGIPLENIASDQWSWECNSSFEKIEYKILINDERYENGPNHVLNHGATEIISPFFS